MRRDDLTAERQACLVHSPDYPHIPAYVPPATPRHLPVRGFDRTLARAHEALGRLRGAVEGLPNPDLVTHSLARREAVDSSRIEGTAAGLDDLYEYECTMDGDGLPPDVRITHNYVVALEYGLAAVRRGGGREALTLNLVKDMHLRLMEGTGYRDAPGEFRVRQNWIGAGCIEDASFVPPPASEVMRCMEELQDSMLNYRPLEDEQYELGIITQLAIAHAQFETIHPFRDGNGRVGRLILPLMLAGSGYPPLYLSGHLHRNQRDYYRALKGVQLRGEWSTWLDFLVDAVEASADQSVALARDLLAIKQRWTVALADLRADATAHRLPDFLIEHPATTVTEVSQRLGVTFPAANAALRLLVERKLIQEPAGRRNRIFVASEILDRLKRP